MIDTKIAKKVEMITTEVSSLTYYFHDNFKLCRRSRYSECILSDPCLQSVPEIAGYRDYCPFGYEKCKMIILRAQIM